MAFRNFAAIVAVPTLLFVSGTAAIATEHNVTATSTGTSTGSTSGVTVTTSTTGSFSSDLANGGFGGTATTSGTVCIDGGFGCEGINVPEPSGAALLMLGLGLYAARTIGRRRRK